MNEISYGERGIIGLIYPNTGWVMEPEFYAMAPKGVITVTTRIPLMDVSADSLRNLNTQIGEAAKLLDGANSDVIVLGCTSGSFIGGKGYDQKIIDQITAAAPGLKASTTATAVIHAIESFGAKKLAVGTPYVDEVNQRAKEFLYAHGYEITRFKGLGLIRDSDINSLPREQIKQLIRDVNTDDADMVVLFCTSVKGVDILEEMEQELHKPVVTAIQATFWECMNLLNRKGEVKGFGSLFDR